MGREVGVGEWYDVLEREVIGEGCVERMVDKGIKFEVKGERVRKKY